MKDLGNPTSCTQVAICDRWPTQPVANEFNAIENLRSPNLLAISRRIDGVNGDGQAYS